MCGGASCLEAKFYLFHSSRRLYYYLLGWYWVLPVSQSVDQLLLTLASHLHATPNEGCSAQPLQARSPSWVLPSKDCSSHHFLGPPYSAVPWHSSCLNPMDSELLRPTKSEVDSHSITSEEWNHLQGPQCQSRANEPLWPFAFPSQAKPSPSSW